MAKSPKNPSRPKKDPARPTRAKAARPDAPQTPEALAELLNPGIARGTAGLGSGTGPDASFRGTRDAREPGIEKPAPSEHLNSGAGAEPAGGRREAPIRGARSGLTEKTGLQPPPDNSWSTAFTKRRCPKAWFDFSSEVLIKGARWQGSRG